jgi:hypothetical protein
LNETSLFCNNSKKHGGCDSYVSKSKGKMMSTSGRGGSRTGGGRPSIWQHSPTRTIRVPEVFAEKLLEIAEQLDKGLDGELIISPKDLKLRSQVKQEKMSFSKIRVYQQAGHKTIRISDLISVLQTYVETS